MSVVTPPLAPPDNGNPNNRAGEQNDEGASPIKKIYPKRNRTSKKPSLKRTSKETREHIKRAERLSKQIQTTTIAIKKSVEGKSIAQLAKEFNLDSKTVSRRMAAQREEEIVERARGIIAERLIPKAMAVVSKELDSGNYNAARDVLKGSQVYKQGSEKSVTHKLATVPTLEQIREERQKRLNGVIEAEVIKK